MTIRTGFLTPTAYPLALCALLAMTTPSIAEAQSRLELTSQQQLELALLDAVATGLGSARSWLRNDPEAATTLLADRAALVAFATERLDRHRDADRSTLFGQRLQTRTASLAQGIEQQREAVAELLKNLPKQIATELKRQQDAVDRYRKAKRPRPSSFAYIPKTVQETGQRLALLTAAGADTKSLREQFGRVSDEVRSVLASMEATERAKANRPPRDSYKHDDRDAIEEFVRSTWKGAPITHVLIPTSRWEMTYGATVDRESGQVTITETEHLTLYVATAAGDGTSTLHPMRLERPHFKVHGKLLDREGPGEPHQVPSHEWPLPVLTEKLR